MKIRINYVSNSSSSSFICDVCGREEIVYDATARDVHMIQCENGHTFCEEHQIPFEHTVNSFKEYLKQNLFTSYMTDETLKMFEDFYDTEFDNIDDMNNYPDFNKIQDYYEDCVADIGEDHHVCPICTFKNIKLADGYKYLLKKYNITEKDLLEEFSNEFKSYDELKDYIKNN